MTRFSPPPVKNNLSGEVWHPSSSVHLEAHINTYKNNMKLIVVFSCLVALVACEIKEEEGVLVLTEKNFEEATKDDQHVLVEFCK